MVLRKFQLRYSRLEHQTFCVLATGCLECHQMFHTARQVQWRLFISWNVISYLSAQPRTAYIGILHTHEITPRWANECFFVFIVLQGAGDFTQYELHNLILDEREFWIDSVLGPEGRHPRVSHSNEALFVIGIYFWQETDPIRALLFLSRHSPKLKESRTDRSITYV